MSVLRFVRADREGAVLVVTFDRPEVLNALHAPAHAECAALFDAFLADDDLRVAIVTGAGDRAFCVGNDLKYAAKTGGAVLPPTGFAGLTARAAMAKPVIAAVNGLALGGGFEAALACDIIVAGAHARFGLPEPKVGMAALAGGLLRLPRAIGMKRAMAMMLTGRQVSAEEGERFGFVSQVAAPGTERDAARAIAAEIVACGPAAIRATRDVAMRGADLPLAEALARQGEWESVAAMRTSPDYREGPHAFAEKRPPRWSGR